MTKQSRFDLKDIFPFHWADFIVPTLFAIGGVFGATEGAGAGVAIGDGLAGFAMALAVIGLVVFPIRCYRRRANPLRVARNLLISNATFAVLFAIGGSLAPGELKEEGETANEARLYLALGAFMFAIILAGISLAIFFALSRARAKRELQSHMETV